MAFLHNITTVARYEAKTLRRSWFFRLFALGALFILSIMNLALFSPIGDEPWQMISIPSALPMFNLYLVNIGQSLIVIFLASDFLKRDKKVDTNEVLYTRSMSNFEYIFGKSWGILRLFLGLDIIILCIGLLMNIISKSMSIDILSYLWYLLIICVPTILFSLGLAFMLMSVIRNQAITFLILLGIAALNMFWLWYRAGSIFDYMAFGLPVFKSGIIGFDDPAMIFNQRMMYFCLGISLVFATVLLFKRLPQSKLHTSISWVLMLFSFGGAALCGFNTWSSYKRDLDEKSLAIGTNRKFENRKVVSLKDAAIDFTHKGTSFEATAELKFLNDNKEPVAGYLFCLNPYLKVTRITCAGREVSFTQTNNIVETDAARMLEPGQHDSLEISYEGSIDESFCYPNFNDNIKENSYRVEMLNVHKRQAFLTEDYVLLTPEAYWYPVPGLNYYPSNPARIKVDFTNFILRVKNEEGLTAVSQGSCKSENGYSVFTTDSPLTGLTLAIGNYQSDTLVVDSVKYISSHFPGNDYYKKDLAAIKDTLPLLISGIMRELETNFSTKYPFRTLSLLEVPVQFFSYPKMSTQTRAELQPSMVLLPERLSTIENAGFSKQFARQKKRMTRSNQVITDKELQVRLFNNFVRNTFISGENFRFRNGVVLNEPTRYRLGPSFYFFKNNFYSSEYPVINAVFESHLQKLNTIQAATRGVAGGLSDNDRANLILKNRSFREILAKNPQQDTIRSIVTIKGDYLLNLLRSKAGINEFNTWFQEYLNKNKFRRVDITQFNSDVKDKFGFGFYPYLDDWFNTKEQPGFLFTGIQAEEIIVGERVRYLVTFTSSNPEPVAGIFNVSFRTGGPGGQRGGGGGGGMMGMGQGGPGGGGGGGQFSISMQGRGMEAADISKIILVGPAQAKRIKIILDAQPRSLMINTLISKNLPGEITIPIDEVKRSKNQVTQSDNEEILSTIPEDNTPGVIIIDNEDPGFDRGSLHTVSPLKKLLHISGSTGEDYQQINTNYGPERWQNVVQSTYYGKYVLSSVYTRKGTGDRSVSWTAKIDEPGFYDIYCYIGKLGDRMGVRAGGMMRGGGQGGAPGGRQGGAPGGGPGGAGGPGGPGVPGGQGGQQPESPYKDFHYKIHHDEGVDEIAVDFESADPGWNNMGRYYLSSDSAKVELTNLTTGKVVLGDAIKWVKAE
jgi:hypothetical protein